ncbi:MAG: flavin reductase [Rectinema sp.]|nr:flavin reductase [Rectinema sp.]
MMRHEVPREDFHFDPAMLRDRWMVLCAGDYSAGRFNAMTISWGSCGQIWNKLFFQVFVRPTRYTYEFMEHYDTFTLSVFEPSYKKALTILGSESGRDSDKIAHAELTPEASWVVAAPSFREAQIVFECRKMYWHDIDPAQFLDAAIEENYPKKDYHRAYFGEIVHISMT